MVTNQPTQASFPLYSFDPSNNPLVKVLTAIFYEWGNDGETIVQEDQVTCWQ